MTGNRKQAMVLQPRDRQLLLALGKIRILDRDMAKVVAGFHSTTRANTRLLQLTRAGLLNRFFVGTVAAGRKAVYTLSEKGAALVDADYRGLKRSHDENLVGDLFVEHQLALAAIFVIVKCTPVPTAGVQVLKWLTFRQPPIASTSVIPDAYFEQQTPSGIRSMFLEVDLGTETLKVWQKKIAAYLQLATSGEFSRKFGQQQFRVLVMTRSERRMQNIRSVIAKSTDKIFWLTTFESIHQRGFWSAVWLRPSGDQRHSLI